jgi:hypothetical protein
MKTASITAFVAASLLAATAWAQRSDQPLNLKLPANLPASSASAAATSTAAPTDAAKAAAGGNATPAPANATAQANAGSGAYSKDPPGTYYGDTSGALGDTQAAASAQPAATCDDATYNQPQVHGAITTGVMAGNHFSGSYGGAGVTLSQAFGSCEHPTGGMSISVSGSQGHFGR